jgi:hypothetical protein
MSEDERITVGAVSAGDGGAVDLPVVELLTGRGFVTGKSGSGKSNTASVVAEKLLDGGYGLLIVDIDGEYYGLKEEYEILHVGADEECDIQVGPQHAEKIAQLALEKHVPIILDVSSFLDESEANELLTEVARHLFAKEKKLKQPFLLVVEEVHEYLPEGGGLDECGRMLIKVAKRGRKHGLGMCGISQRPADVKKDFITQCDWLVWHRLTWQNDTKVVRRILGSDYADGVEELNDGEGYLMTDWDEHVRQVQFQRKRTFDAGATPGLDDFERPELKSVSDDLVSDLERITEEQRARESRIKELERELKDRELRIEELETELEEARDLSEMAEQFSRAMMAHATGRPFREDVTGYQASLEESSNRTAAGPADDDTVASDEDRWREAVTGATDGAATDGDGPAGATDDATTDGDGPAGATDGAATGDEGREDGTPPDEHARPRPEADGSMTGGDDEGFEPAYEPWPDEEDLLAADGTDGVDAVVDESAGGSALAGEPPGGDATAGAGHAEGTDAPGGDATAEADGGADILVPGDESEAATGAADWDGSFDDTGGGDILVPGQAASGGSAGGDTAPESGGDSSTEAGDEPDTEAGGSGGDIIVPGEDDGDSAGPSPAGDEGAAEDVAAERETGPSGGDDIIVPGETDTDPDETDTDPDESDADPDGPTTDGADGGEEAPRANAGADADADGDGSGSGGGDIVVPGEDPITGDGSADEPDGGTADAAPGRGERQTEPGSDGADTTDTSFAERDDPEFERPVVREVRETVESLDPLARGMLAYYRSNGPASPVDAQVAAGGDGDRTRAYGRNRSLREAGLVAHAGRGRYGYALRSRIDEAHDGRLAAAALDAAVERVEAAFLDRSDAPWPGA